MARTHAAGTVRPEYSDDGVVLGKGGEPIPTTPTRGVQTMTPHIQHMDDGEIVAAPRPETSTAVEYEYVCDRTTWQRNMDGFQALHLLSVMLGPLSAVLSQEEYARLPADVRWHLKRRPKAQEDVNNGERS
jgi:hypothetical protein